MEIGVLNIVGERANCWSIVEASERLVGGGLHLYL